MKRSHAMMNRIVDLLMNKKLSIDIVESFAFIISYALAHGEHDLPYEKLATLLQLIKDERLN